MPQLQTMAQLALSLTSALKRKRSLTLSGCTASLFSAIRKCTSNSWIGNSRCFRDWSTYQSRKRKRLEAGAGLPYARSRQALHPHSSGKHHPVYRYDNPLLPCPRRRPRPVNNPYSRSPKAGIDSSKHQRDSCICNPALRKDNEDRISSRQPDSHQRRKTPTWTH